MRWPTRLGYRARRREPRRCARRSTRWLSTTRGRGAPQLVPTHDRGARLLDPAGPGTAAERERHSPPARCAGTAGSAGSRATTGSDHEYPGPLLLFDEEVPRSGARISAAYQYARWIDGSTHVWRGRRKETGRGEGAKIGRAHV